MILLPATGNAIRVALMTPILTEAIGDVRYPGQKRSRVNVKPITVVDGKKTQSATSRRNLGIAEAVIPKSWGLDNINAGIVSPTEDTEAAAQERRRMPREAQQRGQPAKGFRPASKAATRRIHLHIENSSKLDHVFAATPKRVSDALARHPRLKGKLKITIGHDCDCFEGAIRTADVLFAWDFDRRDLATRAPRLRWIHVHGAGVSHLMPLEWLPPGAVLTNSRGVHGPKADEYTAMALLMLNNGLPRIVWNQRRARWEQVFNTSIATKTLVIVGVGHVGGGAAKWAKKFGLYVIGIRRTGKPHRHVDEMYTAEALRKVLPRADFVLVSAPLTDATRHMIGAKELALLKPGVGLINYSRANLVDYGALLKRLERGELTAILDVFDPEPLPRSSPLWKAPNLIITPHCLSDDREQYTPRTLDLVFRNMIRFIERKPLLNRVDPELQY
jgi:phosphoglycerate dehydrogenase-like enzyme